MKWKRILVVYYSRSGNTKMIAENIAKKLNCEIEEIKTSVSYSGFFGYQRAAIQAIFHKLPRIKPIKKKFTEYDLIIIGGPIWASSISAPIRSFLTNYKDSLNNVAFFSTQGGTFGEKNLIRQMKQVARLGPTASLSITQKDLHDGTFKEKTLSFLSKLQKGGMIHERRKKVGRGRGHFTVAQAQR